MYLTNEQLQLVLEALDILAADLELGGTVDHKIQILEEKIEKEIIKRRNKKRGDN